MLKFDNVTKKYGDITVFENLNLEVSDGDRLVIMGKSGCGKTTLLNLVSHICSPDGGVITGTEKFSYMFQEPRLLPWYTSRKNIYAVLEKDKYEVAEKYISLTDIEDFADKYTDSLSGGMAQRVSFARFLCYAEATESKLLILDEPFSALDAQLADRMIEILADFAKDKTLLLVTHNSDDAQKLGAKIINL